jgi:hypothetical protein
VCYVALARALMVIADSSSGWSVWRPGQGFAHAGYAYNRTKYFSVNENAHVFLICGLLAVSLGRHVANTHLGARSHTRSTCAAMQSGEKAAKAQNTSMACAEPKRGRARLKARRHRQPQGEAGTLAQTMYNVPPLALTGRKPAIEATHSMPTQSTLVSITLRVLAVKVARETRECNREHVQHIHTQVYKLVQLCGDGARRAWPIMITYER